MEFKVGDKVRLTRKALHNKCASPTRNEIFGGEVNNIDKDGYYTVVGFEDDYLEQSLELIPEELEFEYGEEVEVSNNGTEWEERIFLAKIPGNPYDPYVCVDMCEEEDFALGKRFEWSSWEYIRKHKPQLTRKEIAEKFGIFEDFVLVDDISSDEI